MNNMVDYVYWRGDILFSQLPPNPVDMLIFSELSYLRFDGIVPEDPRFSAPLRTVVKTFLSLEDAEKRCRVSEDLTLLKAAADSARFGNLGLTFYRNRFIPQEDTQFAAITYLLDDGSACLAFRGTDNTLVGWREDFDMTFQDSVPAQRLAKEYTEEFAAGSEMPLRLTGHSKGGNLAVYAGAKSEPAVQARIREVYNQDGPGFTEHMMSDPGYLALLPKIRTFVPQASVFGMLLERREGYTVIKSSQFGLMQHDPHSWEVMGGNFLVMEERTQDSYFLDKTFRAWLEGMTREERSKFFDAVFDLLMQDNVSRPRDILKPQNILTYFRALHMDENTRSTIVSVLSSLIQSAREANSRPQLPDSEDPHDSQ